MCSAPPYENDYSLVVLKYLINNACINIEQHNTIIDQFYQF